MTGLALVCGYALLGSTWLIMKTEDETQRWARLGATISLIFVTGFMILVSLTTPFVNAGFKNYWLSWPHILYLSPLPLLAAVMVVLLWRDLGRGREYRPFFLRLYLPAGGRFPGIPIVIAHRRGSLPARGSCLHRF